MTIDGGGPTPAELGITQQDLDSSKGSATGQPAKERRSLWTKLIDKKGAQAKEEPVVTPPPKDIIAELMPKVQEILAKEGKEPVDEAKMLKLMDEVERSEDLKGNVHTLGEGKERAVILKRIVQTSTESTSYGPAVRPQELVPIGKLTTAQSEWLVVNRKGFIKYAVVDEQRLTIDENSAYFDGRRYPDSHNRDWEGPIHPDKYFVDKTRQWADGVERSIKYNGDKLRDLMQELVLSHKDYPQEPAKNPFDRFPMGVRPPQDDVDKYYHEKDLASFAQDLHPDSGWSTLLGTEEQRKASQALRRGDNPVGFQYDQYHHDFYRVTDPNFVEQALKSNKPLSQN